MIKLTDSLDLEGLVQVFKCIKNRNWHLYAINYWKKENLKQNLKSTLKKTNVFFLFFLNISDLRLYRKTNISKVKVSPKTPDVKENELSYSAGLRDKIQDIY